MSWNNGVEVIPINLCASDVSGKQSDVEVFVYSGHQDAFLGQAKIAPGVFEDVNKVEGWYKLEARAQETDQVTGEIHVEFSFQKTAKKQYGPEDFPVLRLIGKGLSFCPLRGGA